MKVPLCVLVAVISTEVYIQPSLCFSPECPTVIISANQSLNSEAVCTRTDAINSKWQCADFQSALLMAVQLGNELESTSNCVSVAVPPGDHLVTGPVHFGAASVYMFGSGERSEDVSISCNYTVDVNESRIFELDYNYTDYTFYFNRSEVVSFEMLQFVGCPYPLRLDTVAVVRIHNSTFRNFTEAVFDIYDCSNISITYSSFVDNSGTGISRYSYRGNTGAISIGYNNIPIIFSEIVAEIRHCNFTNNKATAERRVRSSSSAFGSRIFPGRGGAVGVFYNESYHDVVVRISDNHFQNNYARSFGGAIYLNIFGEGTQNIHFLERNTFVNNFAVLGGGAILNTFFSNGVVGRPHSTFISACMFEGNAGQTGGALFVNPAYEISTGVSFVRCERCIFIDNHGINSIDEFGAAIAIYQFNYFGGRESAPKYEFIDCTFENNSGNNGIFTIAYTPLLFKGTNRFVGNRRTDALRIISSIIDFYGEIHFINNTADDAVAMHLISFGQVRVFSGLQMTFTGNNGIFGASIMVDFQSTAVAFSDQLANNPQCFIVHEDPLRAPGQWNNVSVTFDGNKAVLGSSLLISSLDTCSFVSEDADSEFNTTYIYDWPIWKYGDHNNNTGYVDSSNNEHSVVTSVNAFKTANKSVRVWPGQRFQIELKGTDQFSRSTTANVRFSLNSQFQGVVVNFTPEFVVIDSENNMPLTEVFQLTYTISSGDALTSNISLGNVTINEAFSSTTVKPGTFLLYPSLCLAGYDLHPSDEQQGGLECQCEEGNQLIINCEDDQDKIIIKAGYWGVAIKDDLFLYPCPPGYCKCSQNTSLGPSSCAFTYTNSEPDAQCVCGRQGVLCGECRDGKGVSVLLNNCVTCPGAQGLLILALIVADAIAFLVIVLSDVPLPGWVYPFVFYIQTIPLITINFPESFIKGGKFLHFISSSLSFYFIYDFCLYKNMNPLVSYSLKYLPTFLALIMLPAASVFRKKKLLKHHGIWWIVLLLYSNLIHASMSILRCSFIPSTSNFKWFVSGDITCFAGWHIPLALLAIVTLVVAVLLIPSLALISWKMNFMKKCYWLEHFEHPLTVLYKEKWRWWSAVELARRFIIILFVIPYPQNSLPPLLVVCIILAVYGYIQPYKSLVANIMEIVVQTNFILLLALESNSFLRDTYNTFPPLPNDRVSLKPSNDTATQCNDSVTGVSELTKILLPFLYFPVFLFTTIAAIIAITKLIKCTVHVWKRRSAKKRSLWSSADSFYVVRNPVSTTEIGLSLSNSYSPMPE